MGGVNVVVCRCGQSFIATAGEVCCSVCEAVRDPLVCAACGTRLLEAVVSGVCGICDEDWVERLVAA